MKEIADLLRALLEVAAGNQGGFVLAALVALVLGFKFYRRLNHCEDSHAKCERRVQRLALVVVQLHSAAMVLSGRRDVEVLTLDELLDEETDDEQLLRKLAVVYHPLPPAGTAERREA